MGKKSRLSQGSEGKMRGYPTKVKIGYRDIKIKYVRPDFINDDMTDSYGEFRARPGEILIQHDLCGQERCNTTFHEIMHAAVYISGLNQANGPLKEDDAEELVTNQLSNFMIGVFRDNPWVLDMLKKYINES